MKILTTSIFLLTVAAQVYSGYSRIESNDFLPKIVGGENVSPNEYPFQVALTIHRTGNRPPVFCGGSLIKFNQVLTAAHCLDGVKFIEVLAGAHDLTADQEPNRQFQLTTISKIHDEWNSGEKKHDIAIVTIPEPFVKSDGVDVVELQTTNECTGNLPANPEATTIGWGNTSDKPNSNNPTLKQVTEKMISNAECNKQFGNIENNHICLDGSKGKGSCNGDFGGPLITKETSGKATLIGIASFASAWGCQESFPTVYTRVSCYVDWINPPP